MQPAVVAFNEPGRTPLPDVGILVAVCDGADVVSTSDRGTFLAAIDSKNPLAIITNSLDSTLLETVRDKLATGSSSPSTGRIVLMVDRVIAEYSRALDGKDHEIADHFIALRPGAAEGGSNWTVTDLRATMQKIIRRDVFGLEKYLRSGASTRTFPVTSGRDRETLTPLVGAFVIDQGLSQHTASTIRRICEEMLMNAIYDAPRAAGRSLPGDAQARSNVELAPADQAVLEIGYDGDLVAIGIRDPFGLFQRSQFFQYARKVLHRANSEEILDKKVEGAGIGMMTLYFNSHGLVCNVAPGRSTEVIALIDTRMKSRDFEKVARSIHYFTAPTTGVSAK